MLHYNKVVNGKIYLNESEYRDYENFLSQFESFEGNKLTGQNLYFNGNEVLIKNKAINLKTLN
jgi:hypothetical protein